MFAEPERIDELVMEGDAIYFGRLSTCPWLTRGEPQTP
jgi:hypothetical protein